MNMNRLVRARASTWSSSAPNPEDHDQADANSTGNGTGTGTGNGNGTGNQTPNTNNTNRKLGGMNNLKPGILHKRQTSNSSQNSKLSISSWDCHNSTSIHHIGGGSSSVNGSGGSVGGGGGNNSVSVTSTTNTNNNRALGSTPLEILTSLDDDPQDNMEKELQLQLQLQLKLQELEDKTPTAGNSKYHQKQLLEQKVLNGASEFFFPIGIPNPDDKGTRTGTGTGTGTDEKEQELGKDEDTFMATHENANAMDLEMGSPLLLLQLQHQQEHLQLVHEKGEDEIYPPNLNIATGPLNVVVLPEDSAATTSLEFHDAESPPRRRIYSHDEQEGGQDDDDDDNDDHQSLSIQQSLDTFDTPNSGRSRTSLVRFVNDIKTPLSYVRHPPASLILEDEHEHGHGHGHGQEHRYANGSEITTGHGNGIGIGIGKTHGLMNENRDWCLSMDNHEQIMHPLQPSFQNGNHVYSFNSSDDGDKNGNGSGSGQGQGYHSNSQVQIFPREMSPLNQKGHDRQASYAASIDSLEFNSMRHMDPETCTSGGGSGHERSKIANIMGGQDWYASEHSHSHEYDYESSHGGAHDQDQKDPNRHSHPSNSRNCENYKLGICERLLNACWCWPNARKPSWSRVSSAVVRHAPCFWCCLKRGQTGGTDRVTLTRLNVLCAVFALWQFGVGIFILVVFLSTSVVDRNLEPGTKYTQYYKEALTPNLWMMSGSLLILSVVGFVLFITMVLTIPVIRRVNLVGAIRFMWVLYWVLPLQIFFVIALFDYHNVTDVWIKHWWGAPSMAWFRNVFCDSGTANEECLAPTDGGSNYTSIENWCEINYNETDTCEAIRDSAENKMQNMSYFFFYINAIVGGILVILLLLSLGLLESIISAPIVQRSKETNIPLWLTFPIIFCFATGTTLMFNNSSLVNSDSGSKSLNWIGVCYILSGATFTVSALLGWFM